MPNHKKPEAFRKTHIMKIRLDDIQYSAVESGAEAAGMTMTEYIRHMAVFGKLEIRPQIVVDLPKLEALTLELSRIGNNLNQLTKYFNMGGMRSYAMQQLLTECINEIMKTCREVMKLGGEYRGDP